MFCPQCGENLPDGAGFCSKCGATMPTQQAPVANNVPMGAAPAVRNASPGLKVGGVNTKTTTIIAIVFAVISVVLATQPCIYMNSTLYNLTNSSLSGIASSVYSAFTNKSLNISFESEYTLFSMPDLASTLSTYSSIAGSASAGSLLVMISWLCAACAVIGIVAMIIGVVLALVKSKKGFLILGGTLLMISALVALFICIGVMGEYGDVPLYPIVLVFTAAAAIGFAKTIKPA